MANIYEGTANFIRGLSDLWTRFFRERPQLEAMYKGTEILAGQAYLDVLGNILSISVRNAPRWRRDLFKLMTIREDELTTTGDGSHAFELTPLGLKDFMFIYNKIFDPTVVLEKEVHYTIDISGATDELLFKATYNPFDWQGSGTSIPGVPYRFVDVLDDDGNTQTYKELAFWIPDAKIDDYDMYLNFGHLVGRFEASSETYRALLQGVMQYFILGPTKNNLTSALNVIVGLPVIREDGEVLQSVDESSVSVNLVITNRNSYSFPKVVPIREDVLDQANWGVLEFTAFEHLTEVFTVRDNVDEPTWWYGREISDRLLPDENRLRRQVRPEMYENMVNNPPGLVKVGDFGVFVGADFDGYVPDAVAAGKPVYEGLLWRPTYRPSFGYMTFERFLKHHTYAVDFDNDVLQAGLLPFDLFTIDLQNIIMTGRSAYTFMIAEPATLYEDTVTIAPDAAVTMYITDEPDDEVLYENPTPLVVGESRMAVGDYFDYAAAGPLGINWYTVAIDGPWPGWLSNAGKTPLIVGGPDPLKNVMDASSEAIAFAGSVFIGWFGFPNADQAIVYIDNPPVAGAPSPPFTQANLDKFVHAEVLRTGTSTFYNIESLVWATEDLSGYPGSTFPVGVDYQVVILTLATAPVASVGPEEGVVGPARSLGDWAVEITVDPFP